jgi:hypothetical protein
MAKRTTGTSGAANSIDINALGEVIARKLADIQQASKKGKDIESLTRQLQEQKEALSDYNDEMQSTIKNEAERLEAQAEYQKLVLQALKTERDLAVQRGEDATELNAQLEKQRENLKALTEESKNFSESFAESKKITDSFAGSIGITENGMESFVKSAAKGKFSLKGFGAAAKESFSPLRVGTSILGTAKDATLNLIKATDAANASLKKTFGVTYGKELISSTQKVYDKLNELGLGIEYGAVSEAMSSLSQNMGGFIDLSDDARQAFGRNAAIMEKFGVSTEDFSEVMESLTKGFRQTGEQARENGRELLMLSKITGKSAKSIVSDFKSLTPYLSQFGNNAEKVFRRLEVLAAKTGAELSDLQGIAQGFDTFEDAANSVGQLNNILGGPFLNTIDMMNTDDPSEIILKMNDAFKAAGVSIKDMTNRRELQMFAKQIPGINGDIEKMKKIFSDIDQGVFTSIDAYGQQLDETAQSAGMIADSVKGSMTKEEAAAALQQKMAIIDSEQATLLNTGMTNMINGLAENTTALMVVGAGLTAFGAAQSFAQAKNLGGAAVNLMRGGAATAAAGGGAAGVGGAAAAGGGAAGVGGAAVAETAVAGSVAAEGAAATATTAASVGTAAAATAVAAGAVVGAAGALEGLALVKGTSFFTELQRAKTGVMAIGSALGMTEASSVEQQALVAKIAEMNDHLATAKEEGNQAEVDRLTTNIQRATEKLQGMQSGTAPRASEELDTQSFALGGFVDGATPAVVGDVTGGEIIMPLEKAADFMVGPLKEALGFLQGKADSAGRAVAGAASGLKPNINLTVVLEGRELRAYVKDIVTDTLNPFK